MLEAHYRLLLLWNRTLNLSAITGLEEAVERHYCESLFLGAHLPPGSLAIVDIGSGAGFPGLPVAVLRPECSVTLIESHQRKAVFLREASRGLPGVRVVAKRAEDVRADVRCGDIARGELQRSGGDSKGACAKRRSIEWSRRTSSGNGLRMEGAGCAAMGQGAVSADRQARVVQGHRVFGFLFGFRDVMGGEDAVVHASAETTCGTRGQKHRKRHARPDAAATLVCGGVPGAGLRPAVPAFISAFCVARRRGGVFLGLFHVKQGWPRSSNWVRS